MKRAEAFALVNAHGGKPREGVTKERVERSRMVRLKLGKPVRQSLFGPFGSGNIRSFDEPRG